MWQGDGGIHVCSTQSSLGLVFKTEQKIQVSCHTHKECFTHPARPPASVVLCTDSFVSAYGSGAIYCLIAHGYVYPKTAKNCVSPYATLKAHPPSYWGTTLLKIVERFSVDGSLGHNWEEWFLKYVIIGEVTVLGVSYHKGVLCFLSQ